MGGWTNTGESVTRLNGRVWTDEALHISSIVGHQLNKWSKCDGEIPGQHAACHAEKQLIAFFVTRHCFLPRDENSELHENEICWLHRERVAVHDKSPGGLHLKSLETERDAAWDERDLHLDAPGDRDNEQLQRVWEKTEVCERQGSEAKTDPDVQDLRRLEQRQQNLRSQDATRLRLVEMSQDRPPFTLARTIIFISAPSYAVCEDCKTFLEKVNSHFGLEIELRECTMR